MKKILQSVLLIFSTVTVFAQTQIKRFDHEPVQFFEQMTQYIAATNEGEADAIMAEFSAVWNQGAMDPKKQEKMLKAANDAFQARMKKSGVTSNFVFTSSTAQFNGYQMNSIYELSNIMLKKRMKAVPEFKDFLTALIGFIVTDQDEDSFDAWYATMNKLVNKNKRNYKSFVETTNNLFVHGSIFISPNVTWTGTSKRFIFDFDSLPKVVFQENMDLYCVARKDTAFIYNTRGTFYPTTNTFYGKDGKVNWVRAGISEDVSYALLNEYRIKLKSPFYKADSVTYFNSKYFDAPLKGMLEEKLMANVNEKNATYPRFKSYSKRVKIDEIEPNIDFDGGFYIKGAKFLAQGDVEQAAKLKFKYDGKVVLVASSENFSIREDQLISTDASILIYLDEDSIFHPTLNFKYLTKSRELTLYREEKGLSNSPYYNSYHKVDMYVEWMKWKIDEPNIDMRSIIGSTKNEIDFESADMYDEGKFLALQGLSDQHPLYRVRQFVMERNDSSKTFDIEPFASYMRLDINDAKRLLIHLANQGFLIYDIHKESITVQDRLFYYIYAKSGKSDYDNISIHSEIEGVSNATLSLLTNDIRMRGVRKITLSDAKRVYIYPSHRELVLHKNRDMTFGGAIKAGMMEFFGKTFEFTYNDFKIDLLNTDSVRMFAPLNELDGNGRQVFKRVASSISHVNGELLIDDTFNKSGIDTAFSNYPIFNSQTESYVYFNKRNKQGAVYDESKVYFKIKPFSLDSLSQLTRQGVQFDGMFASGGIFPDFDEKLILMDDHSLGFKKQTPPGGYPMYGGIATFHNEIQVSNAGIKGDGDLKYITSTTKSNSFTFYVDSTNAVAQNYDVVERVSGVEYPDVTGKNVDVHFEPYNDKMWVSKIDAPLEMYKGEAKLNGTLVYGGKEMAGKGMMDFVTSELTSNDFKYQNFKFHADTSNFLLKAGSDAGTEKVDTAFHAINVNAKINFQKREGDFVNNGGASLYHFPKNQYVCSMDQFKWFMDQFQLEMSSSDDASKGDSQSAANNDMDLSGSEFISTHRGQDSLKFISPKANYDLKEYVIRAHEVKYINVADARIYPVDGEVVVEPEAKMLPLENAKILANTITQYHTITNSRVNIRARRDYAAEGDYEYVDETGAAQQIRFNDIGVDSTYQTTASGLIKEEQGFKLSPYFNYIGEASIKANRKGIHFDGGAQLVHNCKIKRPWLSFEADVDPKNVMIPVDTASFTYGKVKNRLNHGLYLKKDSTHIYPTIASFKKFHSDLGLVTATGFLKYDIKNREYRIGDEDRLTEQSLPGNYVAMSTKTCSMSATGKMDIAWNMGQVKMNIVGAADHNADTDSTKFDMIMTLDFMLDNSMWKHIENNIDGNPALAATNNNTVVFERGLRELLGKKEADKLISEQSLYGAFKKVPSELEHNLVLTELKMKWDPSTNSFLSEGMIGIGLMGSTQVNKKVNGYVQVLRKRKQEIFNLYIEIDDNTWYFFTYTNGVLASVSSAPEYNAIINSVKPEKRENKGEKDEGPYTYTLSTERKKRMFLNSVEK